MKTKLILGSFLALATIANAQVWTTGAGQETTPGKVGIGTAAPSDQLNVVLPASTQWGGITIKGNHTDGTPWLRMTAASPGSSFGDWLIGSESAGNFIIFDAKVSTSRMVVNPSGNVGIGTLNPINGKFEVNTLANGTGINTGAYITANANSSAGSADYYGVVGRATSNNGLGQWQVGVAGEATTTGEQCGGQNMGFRGIGSGARVNIGGLFVGAGASYPGTCCLNNIGVWGTYGLYCGTNNWAGYFTGNVGISGSIITVSDKKLKKDIKPLDNMLEKIMMLKPSSYSFKDDEDLKDLNLPKGNQLGLIAQELEEVFPELITDVEDMNANVKENNSIHTPNYKGVQYLPLISVLIAGIQEQQKTIQAQSNINSDQQKQLDDQKQLIDALTQKVSGTTGINNVNNVETGFQMSQNEPNPFTHETMVKYTLPTTISNAFMAVYDLTGKQITTFPINERGSASVVLTSDKLSAGIYIYSIVADGKVVDSKRMIVAEK